MREEKRGAMTEITTRVFCGLIYAVWIAGLIRTWNETKGLPPLEIKDPPRLGRVPELG